MLAKMRKVAAIIFAVSLLVPVVAFAGGGPERPAAVPENAIRIGQLGPVTGGFALFGTESRQGIMLALEEHNYQVAGRPIRLFSEDTMANVEEMTTRLESLRQRDQVHVIIGPVLGGEGMAAMEWAARNPDMPMLIAYSAPEDITMRRALPNVMRAGWTAPQTVFHFGRFVAQEQGYRRVIIVGQDYSYPWDVASGFIRGFIENGGLEVRRIWHDLQATDFSSILAQIRELSGQYDAVMINSGGAQNTNFIEQWYDFGMDEIFPPLLGQPNTPITFELRNLGDLLLGMYSSHFYYDGSESPKNLEFRQRYRQAYGYYPSTVAVQGYDSAKVLIKALQAVNGDVSNPTRLIEAIRNVRMTAAESPRGPFHFDQFGNAVQNIYIKQVVQRGNDLVNIAHQTYENVSQFGPYVGMEDKYMALPPNSRNYPPGTRAEYMAEIEKVFGAEYVRELERNGGWR